MKKNYLLFVLFLVAGLAFAENVNTKDAAALPSSQEKSTAASGGKTESQKDDTKESDVKKTDAASSSAKKTAPVSSKKTSTRFKPQEHFFVGGVSVIAASNTRNDFFVGGNDGFISRYTYPDLRHESWQISNLPIKHIAVHPKKSYLLIYETDDFTIHRVSLFNWETRKTIFAKRFSGTVVSLSWSAQGNYIFVGNTTSQGVTVLDIHGKVKPVFKTPPGVVMLAITGASEKNVITYGQSGRLVYTSLRTKKELLQHETERNILDPHLINKNTEIVGYKEGSVIVINAISGQVTSKYTSASQPLFANRLTDTVPVWIEHAAQRGAWQIRRGDAQSPLFRLPVSGEISAARHVQSHIVVGTETGYVYMLNQEKDASIHVAAVNTSQANHITDAHADAKHFFVLIDDTIYALLAPDIPPITVVEKVWGNRFTIVGNGFLCWTDDRPASVYYYSLDTNSKRRVYTPRATIKSVSSYDNNILFVESFTGLSVFDFKTGKKVFSHPVTGLQSAVQIDDEKILIAKSAGGQTKRPLEIINMKTGETLPLSITGDLAFGLQHNKANTTMLSCFLVNLSEGKKSTTVVHILSNPQQPLKTGFYSILSYAEEDLNSFLLSDDSLTITNLGNGTVSVYSTHTRRTRTLSRGYSLPKMADVTKSYIITVNNDSTVSWYDRRSFKFIQTVQPAIERAEKN